MLRVGDRTFERDELVALGGEIPFRDLAGDPPPGTTHATFHASDGYAASLPLGRALADASIQVPSPGRTGVRLVVADGATTCLNVKAVTRIEFSAGPGKHTVDPNPHENAFVPGWDDGDDPGARSSREAPDR